MRLFLTSLVLLIPALQETETGKCRSRRLITEGATPEQAEILRRYETEGTRTGEKFEWKLRTRRTRTKYALHELTFPSPVRTDVEENNTVHGRYWTPVDDRKLHPGVVVLHWLGGTFRALELVCRQMAEGGICTLMIYMPHYGPRRAKDPDRRTEMITPDTGKTLANFRQAVLDIRRAGDWLAARPEVEDHRLGLMGVSLGSIIGALVAGVDPRFERCVFIIGGGDLAAIATNESKETEEIREWIRKQGLTIDDLRRDWKAIEPLTFASRIRPETTVMFNASEDEIIPKECTLKLQKAIGVKEIEWFKGGHYGVLFQAGKIVPRSIEHFHRRTEYVHLEAPRLGETVRILLVEGADSVTVEGDGPAEVVAGGEVIDRIRRSFKSKVRADAPRIQFGADRILAEEVILRPTGKSPLRIGRNSYGGEIRFRRRGDKIDVINAIDFESYVAGVLEPELGTKAPFEAMCAQAVCARTFAWRRIRARRAKKTPFDLHDDARDQVYRGRPAAGSPAERAAQATENLLLAWNDEPFTAYFSSTCGGRTESVSAWIEAPEIRPLSGVRCGHCTKSKYYSWKAEVDGDALAKALRLPSPVRDLEIVEKSRSGRAVKVRVTAGDGKRVDIEGTDLRKAIGYDRCRSTLITVEPRDGGFLVRGRGWGHGVGLCQVGAMEMARQGRTFREILGYYYPGSTLKRSTGR